MHFCEPDCSVYVRSTVFMSLVYFKKKLRHCFFSNLYMMSLSFSINTVAELQNNSLHI